MEVSSQPHPLYIPRKEPQELTGLGDWIYPRGYLDVVRKRIEVLPVP
jgi:hypothetical protein